VPFAPPGSRSGPAASFVPDFAESERPPEPFADPLRERRDCHGDHGVNDGPPVRLKRTSVGLSINPLQLGKNARGAVEPAAKMRGLGSVRAGRWKPEAAERRRVRSRRLPKRGAWA